jgi:predicted amidohydrolase
MNLKIASAQYPVLYHPSFAAWKTHTEAWVYQAVRERAQLLLFPEYGSMELVSLLPVEIQQDIQLQVREMERLRDDFCSVFSALARRFAVTIVAPSFPVCLENLVINRCFVFGPQGKIGYQDKYFMTRFELEEWNVQPAPARLCVFEADWGRFGIQICYDVEFPIGAAKLCEAGAQVILAPSCTETLRGATRVHVGARARALEQQCYTVVSPLIGNAPWSPAVDINFGFAAVYSTPDKLFPEEGILQTMPAQQPGWLTQTLDLSLIEAIRGEGQTLNFKSQQAIAYQLISDQFALARETV